MRVGAVQRAAASEGMEATAQSKRTAEINIMAYIPLLDSAVGKELNAMTVNKNADQEKSQLFTSAFRRMTAWTERVTVFRIKSYYVEGGFSHLIHMTAAHLW